MSNENEADGGRRRQDEALERAKIAAATGNYLGLVAALYESYALGGLTKRMRAKWSPTLSDHEVDFLVCEAVDALAAAVKRGERVGFVLAYIWKVADRKADDRYVARQRERALTAEDMDSVGAPEQDPPREPADEAAEEERRRRMLAFARSLIPTIGGENVQAVMTYIFDAVAAGKEDVSNSEIEEALGLTNDTVRTSRSRGFKRLSRVAREKGLTNRDFELPEDEADEPGDEVQETEEVQDAGRR